MSIKEELKKNLDILIKGVVIAQAKGVFGLKDASSLYSSVLSLTSETKDISEEDALSALIQGVQIGQKGGAYSLEDADSIFKCVKWFDESSKKAKKLDAIQEDVE